MTTGSPRRKIQPLKMDKDRRYSTVQKLIKAGYILDLPDIFDTIPKSVVARDLRFNQGRFHKLIYFNPDKWVLKDIFKFAELLEIDDSQLLGMIHRQCQEQRKKIKSS
jgi:hypothetical protein